MQNQEKSQHDQTKSHVSNMEQQQPSFNNQQNNPNAQQNQPQLEAGASQQQRPDQQNSKDVQQQQNYINPNPVQEQVAGGDVQEAQIEPPQQNQGQQQHPGMEQGGLFSEEQMQHQQPSEMYQQYQDDEMDHQQHQQQYSGQYIPQHQGYGNQGYQGGEMYEDESKQMENESQNALSLQWVLGFNKDIQQGVHNLTDQNRREIFYSAAHTGVIYDYVEKTQKLLQGHCNLITATTCSRDKKWIVTGDTGRDSMLVVWDSESGTPVKTIFDPHPHGVRAVDISPNSQYIVTLSNLEKDQNQESGENISQTGVTGKGKQFMSLWDWTATDQEGPLISSMVDPACDDLQTCVIFNPQNIQQIATNGAKRVFFWSWDGVEPTFQYYAPPFRPNQLKSQIGRFTQTVFIPASQQAVTATVDGNIVVWDVSLIVDDNSEPDDRRAIKAVQLNNNIAINVLCLQDDMLVTGNSDGTVRFYDFQFRIKAWFQNLDTKEIISISFANQRPKASTNFQELGGTAGDQVFQCSDFIISDRSSLVCLLESSLFEEIDPNKSKGEVIMRGIFSTINCMAIHPNQPILAMGGKSGFVQTWNYLTRSTIVNRFDIFDKEIPTAMDMSPDGKYLVVGFHNGNIRFLDALEVKDKQEGPLKVSDNNTPAIRYITIAPDSNYLATIDNDECVSLFKIGHRHGDPTFPIQWVFAGKIRAHRRKVSSIAFGESLDDKMKPYLRLFSVGLDRYLFEYSVYNTGELKLNVESAMRIEQEATPTACVWYPQIDSREDLLVTANDEYKMKIWNVITRSSRKTCLGPTYGDSISMLRVIKVGPRAEDKYLIYSTKKKVVGMMKLPLDGNPHKTMGLIAHPDDVIDIRGTTDGKYIFTCGGSDLSINMWAVNPQPIEQAIAMGGQQVEPFISLIQGGRQGQTYQDMKDFFYYSQIRSKDEDTTKTRKLDGTVPLDELSFLMRAMGYYPSNMEIQNMTDEVKYSKFTQTGEEVSSVDIDTFIRLFVNHRPVYGIGKSKIEEAFQSIIGKGQPPILLRDEIIHHLTRDGESINIEQLGECFKNLVGEGNFNQALPEQVTPDGFCEQVLGFQQIDDIDEDENDEMAMGGKSMMTDGAGYESGAGGVILQQVDDDTMKAS